MPIVNLNSVTKSYKNKKQVIKGIENLSMSINEGEIVGLVGPNGSGKSTTVKLISGILTPSDGEISVLGMNPSKHRQKLSQFIGVMFGQRSSLWYNIPVKESLFLMRDIYDIPSNEFLKRVEEYSEKLEIKHLLSTPVRKLSLGQRIRCELLATILHQPKLIILDEPTIGLDITAKTALRKIICELALENKSAILLTTHDLQDVERVCGRVIFINGGNKVLDLEMEQISTIAKCYTTLEIEKHPEIEKFNKSPYYRDSNQDWLKFYLPVDCLTGFLDEIINAAGNNIKFKTIEPNLEDVLYAYYNQTAQIIL